MTYPRNDLDPASKGEGAARTVQLPGPRGGYGPARLLLILATGLWALVPVLAASTSPQKTPPLLKVQVQADPALEL